MKLKRNKGKVITVCMIMLLAVMLQGCGDKSAETKQTETKQEETKQTETTTAAEDLLSGMAEFSTPDGSAFIYLNEKWTTEELGLDTWMTAGNATGSEAVFMFQFPKDGVFNVDSIDSLKEFVEGTYEMSEIEQAEAYEVPGMSNVEAIAGKMSPGGMTAEAYLIYGETDYAYYSIGYVATELSDKMKSSFKASCSTFREEAPELQDATTVELSDTVRWFNASYAVLTELNGWDYNRFAGLPANNDSMTLEKQLLEQSWSVTDRATADETLDWILTEGHRVGFVDDMKYFEECGIKETAADQRAAFLLENFDMTEEAAQCYANSYERYEQYGENAIAGWDYCRALSLMGFYYLAGYYTEQEALDKSLEIAQTMQPLFTSWDELMDSYLCGYEYWSEESSEDRRAIYEDIKSRDDSPYQIDYKMTLEKTW